MRWADADYPCLLIENLSNMEVSIAIKNIRLDGEMTGADPGYFMGCTISEIYCGIDLLSILEGNCYLNLTDVKTITFDIKIYKHDDSTLLHTIKDFDINASNK